MQAATAGPATARNARREMIRFHQLRKMRNFKRLWIMVAFVLEGVALWFEVAAELAYQHSEKKKKRNS